MKPITIVVDRPKVQAPALSEAQAALWRSLLNLYKLDPAEGSKVVTAAIEEGWFERDSSGGWHRATELVH